MGGKRMADQVRRALIAVVALVSDVACSSDKAVCQEGGGHVDYPVIDAGAAATIGTGVHLKGDACKPFCRWSDWSSTPESPNLTCHIYPDGRGINWFWMDCKWTCP